MHPLRGPPFTDAPRRRSGGTPDVQQPTNSSDLKTGSLDRDGVWRPNRLSPSCSSGVGGSSNPVAQGLSYPGSPLFTNIMGSFLRPMRNRPRFPPSLFPFDPNFGIGVGAGAPNTGYEVPIFVVPSPTSPTGNSTPIPSSSAFRQRALSPSGIEIQRSEFSNSWVNLSPVQVMRETLYMWLYWKRGMFVPSLSAIKLWLGNEKSS